MYAVEQFTSALLFSSHVTIFTVLAHKHRQIVVFEYISNGNGVNFHRCWASKHHEYTTLSLPEQIKMKKESSCSNQITTTNRAIYNFWWWIGSEYFSKKHQHRHSYMHIIIRGEGGKMRESGKKRVEWKQIDLFIMLWKMYLKMFSVSIVLFFTPFMLFFGFWWLDICLTYRGWFCQVYKFA